MEKMREMTYRTSVGPTLSFLRKQESIPANTAKPFFPEAKARVWDHLLCRITAAFKTGMDSCFRRNDWGAAILLPVLLLAFFSPALATEKAVTYMEQAAKAYESEDFAGAASLYEKAMNEGAVSPALYYNYANTQFRLQKLGKAILYYEKTLKLSPEDEDARFNLRFANSQTIDKHPEPDQNLITRFLWRLHSGYNLNAALWVMFGLFSGIFLFAAFLLFLPPNARLIIFPLITLIILVLAVMSPSVFLRIKEQESVRYGIVLSPVLEIYSGPGETYQLLAKVHEGTKFEIENISNGWAEVKLLSGKGGFVKFGELGKI